MAEQFQMASIIDDLGPQSIMIPMVRAIQSAKLEYEGKGIQLKRMYYCGDSNHASVEIQSNICDKTLLIITVIGDLNGNMGWYTDSESCREFHIGNQDDIHDFLLAFYKD